jgi:ankyrin repeat protein
MNLCRGVGASTGLYPTRTARSERMWRRPHRPSARIAAALQFAACATVLAVRDGDRTLDRALVSAIERGDQRTATNLLKRGANPSAKSSSGAPVLVESSTRGLVETTKLLLDKGADPNTKSRADESALLTVLNSRQRSGHWQTIVKLLLDKGADAKARTPGGYTALNLVTDYSVVKALIAHGADVNVPMPRSGITPLMMAASRGRADTVRLLLSNKANVQAKDIRGRTALDWARAVRKASVIKLLSDGVTKARR